MIERGLPCNARITVPECQAVLDASVVLHRPEMHEILAPRQADCD
jgi:hypothetical protein